mgnify:CR=1 FL=1
MLYGSPRSKNTPKKKDIRYSKMIDRRANIGGRITIDAYGVENIPKQDGFMLFSKPSGAI